MIMEDLLIDKERYEIPMLQNNSIPHFLSLQLGSMDGRDRLIYDITGKQSLNVVFRRRKLNGRDLQVLFQGLQAAFSGAENYMLRPGRLLLDPEYIYIDRNTGESWFCYLPLKAGEEITSDESSEGSGTDALDVSAGEEENGAPGKADAKIGTFPHTVFGQKLAEFILKHLDHSDEKAVLLGYGFYQGLVVREEGPAHVVTALLQSCQKKPDLSSSQLPKQTSGENTEYFREERSSGPGTAPGHFPDRKEEAAGTEKPASEQLRTEKREGRPGEDFAYPGPENRYPGEKEKKVVSDPGRKRRRKEILICLCAVIFAAAADGLCIWLLRFDLTQAGGMLFLTLALLWLVYIRTLGAKKEQEDPWEGIFADRSDEPDDQYLDRIFEETQEEEERESDPDEEVTRILTVPERTGILLVSDVPGKPAIPVAEGISIIGSSRRQADLQITSDAVSRIHAQIESDGSRCILTDLNSRNGTFVDGNRLEPNQKTVLKFGDIIQFADTGYRLIQLSRGVPRL